MDGYRFPPSVVLGRAERAGNLATAAVWVRGKRVLVTGAAGSVGTPLSHALLAAGPATLVLLDHHEHSLFTLERSVGAARSDLAYELVDIGQERRLRRVFDRYQPEVIFHLAAAKHVPYGERFCDNVVETNVFATERLLDLADEAGTSTFVYPSSDKSVNPPSVYGATKRLCEALVQGRARGRQWVICRYVNIVGTRGSVIETFAAQIKQGATLTVTDERMTRYWMSMNEALWLLLQTGAKARPGEVLMPDCGDPVPVVDTAKQLAGWLCSDRYPYPVNLTGIRPGERLHEMLLSSNESFHLGPGEGIRAVYSHRPNAALLLVPGVVDHLRALVEADDQAGIQELVMQAAHALQ